MKIQLSLLFLQNNPYTGIWNFIPCVISSVITDFTTRWRTFGLNGELASLKMGAAGCTAEFGRERDFRFSSRKIHPIIFRHQKSITYLLPLLLNDSQIPQKDSINVLGLNIDQGLTWIHLIIELVVKYCRSMKALKYLAHPHTGGDRKLLSCLV